jgi:hypothetical protein
MIKNVHSNCFIFGIFTVGGNCVQMDGVFEQARWHNKPKVKYRKGNQNA